MARGSRVRTRAGAGSGVSNGSGGLVDYEDDEDDEDYKPPPKKQVEEENEEEGTLEFRLKRKLLGTKEETDMVKKRRLLGKTTQPQNQKAKESVFATLCSTLSQTVLPKKSTGEIETSQEEKKPEESETEKGVAEL